MGKKIIIGSTALKYYYPDFKRSPKDLDYAVEDSTKFKTSREVEYLDNPILLKYSEDEYLNPDMLLTLKVSHLFWNINWDKHMFDVQFLLSKGHKIQMNLFNDLLVYWKETKKSMVRSNLMMTKEDFFNNAINYDEHDFLHTLLNPIPMYTRILADGKEVELDESKFHLLTFKEKCDVVFEEVAVMAYERFKNKNHNIAFKRMFDKCIMIHFPTYISLFAIENYLSLYKPKHNFIKQIEDELQNNKRNITGFRSNSFQS